MSSRNIENFYKENWLIDSWIYYKKRSCIILNMGDNTNLFFSNI